jgi:hypothetical protein
MTVIHCVNQLRFEPQRFHLFFLLLQTTFHLDAQLLEFGKSTLSAVLGVAAGGIGLLERGLQFADLSSQTGVFQVELVQFAVGIGKCFLGLVQVV